MTFDISLQVSRADLKRSEDKLAETLASMDSVGKSLEAQTKRTEDLQSQVQQSQDRVTEAQAAAAAAEVELKSAEQKVAELADSLDSAKLNREQAVKELQQQHSGQTQVGPSTCAQHALHCPVTEGRACVSTPPIMVGRFAHLQPEI